METRKKISRAEAAAALEQRVSTAFTVEDQPQAQEQQLISASHSRQGSSAGVAGGASSEAKLAVESNVPRHRRRQSGSISSSTGSVVRVDANGMPIEHRSRANSSSFKCVTNPIFSRFSNSLLAVTTAQSHTTAANSFSSPLSPRRKRQKEVIKRLHPRSKPHTPIWYTLIRSDE